VFPLLINKHHAYTSNKQVMDKAGTFFFLFSHRISRNLLCPFYKYNVPTHGYKAMLLPLAIKPTQPHLDLVMFLPICQTLDGQPNHLLHNSPAIFSDYIRKDTLKSM
jgi:hypothetical protein